jgi:hypothetical protein
VAAAGFPLFSGVLIGDRVYFLVHEQITGQKIPLVEEIVLDTSRCLVETRVTLGNYSDEHPTVANGFGEHRVP